MMSEKFDKSIAMILAAESGYVNDPNDPGGETKYGICKLDYPELDIPNLTREQAIAIYEKNYWEPVHGDELPWPLCVYVFDSAVNQGVTVAIQMLQRSLNTNQDGIIGPVTIRLANTFGAWHWHRFMAIRALHYTGTRNFNNYGEGWFIRLFELTAKAQ